MGRQPIVNIRPRRHSLCHGCLVTLFVSPLVHHPPPHRPPPLRRPPSPHPPPSPPWVWAHTRIDSCP